MRDVSMYLEHEDYLVLYDLKIDFIVSNLVEVNL